MCRQDDDFSFMSRERQQSLADQENYRMTDNKWAFKKVSRRERAVPLDNEWFEKQLALTRKMGIKARVDRIKREIVLKKQHQLKG